MGWWIGPRPGGEIPTRGGLKIFEVAPRVGGWVGCEGRREGGRGEGMGMRDEKKRKISSQQNKIH
jgi:hypothetical protein